MSVSSNKVPPVRYPWEEWFIRRTFTLTKGKDYLCSSVSMAQQVRNIASQYRLKVSIDETEKGLFVVVEEG